MATKTKRTRVPADQIANNLQHQHDAALAPDAGHADHDREAVHGARGPPRLLSKVEVLDRTSLSFPYIWRLMQRGDFPRARSVGGKAVWIESEIDEWIANLPIRKFKGDAA